MKFHKIIISLFGFCLFMALPLSAQVKISGKVTDEKNDPIEFATVRIAGTAIGVSTDTKGDYSLSVPERDTIMVIVSCIGYSDVKRQFIRAKGAITLNPRLYEKTHQLKEVQVTEFKKQTNQMQTIDAKASKLTPDAAGGSIESVLTTMAGVSSKNEMSTQYMVRGGTYDENSVYINGIEIYRPQLITSGQQEGLSIINPDMVGSVAFSTGGFNAEYGDKMSSVLDIKYREPEAFEGAFSASLMGGSFSIGQHSKKFSQLHGVRYKRNASLLGSLETKGEYDPQYFDYQTSMEYKPTSKFTVSFLGNAAINNYRFKPETRSTSFGTMFNAKQFTVYFDGQEKDKFETYFGALSMNYRLNKSTDFTWQNSGYLTNELVSYDIQGEYWLDEAGGTDNSGATVGGELGVGRYRQHSRDRLKASVLATALKGNTSLSNNNFSYGVSLQHEKIFDRTREWETRDSAGYSLPHTGDGVNVIYSLTSRQDLSSNRFAAYLQDAYKIMGKSGMLTINGGVRASYWDYNKEFLFSPRASLGFVPASNEKLAFRFAAGLYYQAPFYKEYRRNMVDADGNTYVELNSDIKSQRSVHFILGGDYTFRKLDRPFKLSAELYYKNISNLNPYEIDNLKVVYSGTNNSKGYVTGLDFKFFGQFVEGTDSWISFSLMKTQETLNGVKVPLPTDQRYSVAMYFTDYFPKYPKVKFSLKGILSDGLPMTAPHVTRDVSYFRAPAYKRLDIGVAYELVGGDENKPDNFLRHFKSVWLGLDVFNLFDISNVSGYYWVTDVHNIQYAVPNYLTRRQLNVHLSVNF
jgi:hypothetical protein